MAALTKTQINYFKDRMQAIEHRLKLQMYDKDFKAIPKPPQEERFAAIVNGTAKLKESAIDPDNCSNWRLLDAFEFPGDDERETLNRYFTSVHHIIVDAVRTRSTYLIDEFVLGRIAPDEALAALENYYAELVEKYKIKDQVSR